MVKVTVIKCPNCGASLQGTGQFKCHYCNSVVMVTGGDSYTEPSVNMISKSTDHAGEVVYFSTLPSLPITINTTNIPFDPAISFDKIKSEISPSARAESQPILKTIETVQTAINTEDIELYKSTISDRNPSYYQQAEKGAMDQFITSDMKRIATSVEFIELGYERAMANVSFEAYIFRTANTTTHINVTFRYSMAKIDGKWLIVGSSLAGGGAGGARSSRLVVVAISGAVLVGVLAAGIGVFANYSSGPSDDEYSESETYSSEFHSTEISPDGEGGIIIEEHTAGTDMTDDKNPVGSKTPGIDGFYVNDTPIPIYAAPQHDSNMTTVLMPDGEFKIIDRRKDWTKIQTRDGTVGWTMTIMIDQNL